MRSPPWLAFLRLAGIGFGMLRYGLFIIGTKPWVIGIAIHGFAFTPGVEHYEMEFRNEAIGFPKAFLDTRGVFLLFAILVRRGTNTCVASIRGAGSVTSIQTSFENQHSPLPHSFCGHR